MEPAKKTGAVDCASLTGMRMQYVSDFHHKALGAHTAIAS
jgi:hypothetical protein